MGCICVSVVKVVVEFLVLALLIFIEFIDCICSALSQVQNILDTQVFFHMVVGA